MENIKRVVMQKLAIQTDRQTDNPGTKMVYSQQKIRFHACGSFNNNRYNRSYCCNNFTYNNKKY